MSSPEAVADQSYPEGDRTQPLDNAALAAILEEIGDLLQQQGADYFRWHAYRQAAATLDQLETPITTIASAGGRRALVEIPHVGSGIGAVLEEILESGSSSLLRRLRGQVGSADLFLSVPGIGPELAARIHDRLHIDSLEALETAAHDGRLAQVPGFGPRRLEMVRSALANRLRFRARSASTTQHPEPPPDIANLLEIDRRYREDAAARRLPTISPRRFNPQHRKWLPIGHDVCGPWHFTVLFSNSARAHRLGRTHDWVVVYYYDGDHRESQCTVVTETTGVLHGRRVVRGREAECQRHYQNLGVLGSPKVQGGPR